MSAIKNFFSKKSDQIDGSVALIVVVGALALSGLNMASAAPTPAPVEQVQSVVGGGSAGAVITVEGSAGINLGDK